MSSHRKSTTVVGYDERGSAVDVAVPQPARPVRVKPLPEPIDSRLARLDMDDPDRPLCGHREDVAGQPDGNGDAPIVHLRCTRLVTNQAGQARHAGVHYDRRDGRWFDRLQYPHGTLRTGTPGDHLR